MKNTTKRIIQSFIIVPLVASSLSMNTFTVAINEAVAKVTAADASMSLEDIAAQQAREEKAAKIDAYFAQYDLPLTGYGMQFVLTAEKNGLEWNLLPAIAMRESTGGKFMRGNNSFGWGTAKFKDLNEGIAIVGAHLGGNMPTTAKYYANKTLEKKLSAYNSVIPPYTAEIKSIMSKIEKIQTEA